MKPRALRKGEAMDWLGLANEKRTRLIERTAALVAINTIEDKSTADPAHGAPYGQNLKQALELTLQMGTDAGFSSVNMDGHAGRIACGKGAGAVFGILAHLDTVPIGEGWLTGPFELTKKDGRLHGRGIIDDKGPVVAALTAMEIASALVKEPVASVHLILGCNEETGMGCMKHYAEHSDVLPDFGVTPDNAFPVIFGEKGILRVEITGDAGGAIRYFDAGVRPNVVPGLAKAEIEGGGKREADVRASFDAFLADKGVTGSLEFSDNTVFVSVNGKSCHSQEPRDGINAAVLLFQWVAACFEDQMAADLAALMGDYDGRRAGIAFAGKYMKELTMSLGIAKIINGRVGLTVDIRHPNDIAPGRIVARMEKTVAARQPGWRIALLSESPPLFMDPKSNFIKSLSGIYRDITGDTLSPLGVTGGGTYARLFKNHVAFGPLFPSNLGQLPEGVGSLHQPNEAFEEEHLVDLCAIYARLVYEVLTGELTGR